MTCLDNVQEGQQSMRAGMEPMTAAENLFEQTMEAAVQEVGLSRAEILWQRVFLRAQHQVAAVKRMVPDNLCLEGQIPFMQKLDKWSRDRTLAERLVYKPPKHDRTAADLEGDLYKHILVALACVRADAGGKVHTEQDFLEEDLSAVLPFDVWEQVIEARKYWRKTTMIQTPGADGQTLLIFVYRCEICRDSAEDANAAVSQNTDRHTLPRSHHTHTRSRGL
jgi:hypothetical protein